MAIAPLARQEGLMAIHGLRSEERFDATSREILHQLGVTLSFGSDFEEYRDLVKTERPKQVLGSPFDPDRHDLNEQTALWMIGRNTDGELIHTQAFRSLDLGQQPLASYMRGSFREYSPVGLDLDLTSSRYRPGPAAKRMFGQVIYHGEFWINPDSGDFRSGRLSCIIGRVAFLTVIRKWSPDYLWGLMAKPVAQKGFPMRLGYIHAEPYAVRWKLRKEPTYLEGFMAYMSQEDMRFVLDMPEQDLEALAA